MSAFTQDPIATWAAVLVVVLPLLILGVGEAQERLRQRGSALESTLATIRNWVLPLVALWVLVTLVFGVDRGNFFARVLATAAVAAVVAATLGALSHLADMARHRTAATGARGIPQLVLLLPRLSVLLVAGWLIVGVVWDVDLTGLFAALGVTSLVISLALQPTLSGVASGLLLLGDRPFKPGDWIRADDIEGQVIDLSWRTSRIRDRNGDVVIIPNGKLAEATTYNFAEPTPLHRVVVPVQVAYANAPTSAKEMLLAAARATPGVLAEPVPGVRVVQIDDPLMGYEVDLWIDDYAIAPRVFSEFGSLVWYHSERMGVPLPSPAYDLFHHDPVQEAADAEVGPEDLADRLRTVPYIVDLDEVDIESLAATADLVRYSRGEHIVRSGSDDPATFVLLEGRARIVDVELPARRIDLDRGDLFGFLTERSTDRPVTVTAVSDCVVIALDAETAGSVVSRNPRLTQAVEKVVHNRARRLDVDRAAQPQPVASPGQDRPAPGGPDESEVVDRG